MVACSAEQQRASADHEVYGVLDGAQALVTGNTAHEVVERPVDTLRARLLAKSEPVKLTLVEALDVAAENSREFQRQKEQLYLVGLALTQQDWNFRAHYSVGGDATVSGVGDDTANLTLRDNLSLSQNTTLGTRILAGFVNTFLRSLTSGLDGGWNPSSILSLAITQPLLRGFGERIVREPLTQAERNVIYQVRDYERFRTTFSVRVATDYFRAVQQRGDIKNEENNLESLKTSRAQIEALAAAGLRTSIDVDRARQDELSAEDRYVTAKARLQTQLDNFKLTLGLPTDARLDLDEREFERLSSQGVTSVDVEEGVAIGIALARRLDYRNTIDEVEDAGRRILIAEDALRSRLDFSTAISVPTERNKPFVFEWDKVSWSAGFSLQLALDKLPERNSYRSALIDMDVFIRAKEQQEDQIKLAVREDLRSVRRALQSYVIQTQAVALATRRDESATDLYAANRATALDLLDAKRSLLAAQLSHTQALVDYAVARLNLLRDLDGIVLEPKGLRFDPGLPIPHSPLPDPSLGTDTVLTEPAGVAPR
jgi:outer membrane protein TolC